MHENYLDATELFGCTRFIWVHQNYLDAPELIGCSRIIWVHQNYLGALGPVAQVQDRAVTKSDQHLKTDTIYKVLAFALGFILSKGQNKK